MGRASRSGRAALRRAAIACMAAGAITVACYGPTETRLSFSTDLRCVETKTRITVGEERTDADGCRPGEVSRIGDIVVIPRAARDGRVTVEAVLAVGGLLPDSCHPPSEANKGKCVVARRTFRFIEHTARTLPIVLRADCLDKTCDGFDEQGVSLTCEHGQCVSSDVALTVFDGEVGPEADAGVPVEAAAPDAPPDAPVISAKACPGATTSLLASMTEPKRGRIVANTTSLYWVNNGVVMSFDKTTKGPPNVVGPGLAVAATDQELFVIPADINPPFNLERRPFGSPIVETCGFGASHQTAPEFLSTAPNVGVHAVSNGAPGPGGAWTAIDGFTPCVLLQPASPSPRISDLVATTATTFLLLDPGGLSGSPSAPGGTFPVEHPRAVAVASDGADTFLAEVVEDGAGTRGAQIKRYLDTNVQANLLQIPTQLALDPTHVYWLESANGKGEMYRIPRSTKPSLLPEPELVASGFERISSLVVDSECIYFWAKLPGGIEAPAGLHGVARPP